MVSRASAAFFFRLSVRLPLSVAFTDLPIPDPIGPATAERRVSSRERPNEFSAATIRPDWFTFEAAFRRYRAIRDADIRDIIGYTGGEETQLLWLKNTFHAKTTKSSTEKFFLRFQLRKLFLLQSFYFVILRLRSKFDKRIEI